MQPGASSPIQLLMKQVPPLLLQLPASTLGFLVEAAADSAFVAVVGEPLAVVSYDPSCFAVVVGSWLVPQHPTAGLLAEAVHLAGPAAELEAAIVTKDHPVASLLAFLVAVDLT